MFVMSTSQNRIQKGNEMDLRESLPIDNFVDCPSLVSSMWKKLALHSETGFRQEKQEKINQV